MTTSSGNAPLEVLCWCQGFIVRVAGADLREGRTSSCGAANCMPPEGLVSAPQVGRAKRSSGAEIRKTASGCRVCGGDVPLTTGRGRPPATCSEACQVVHLQRRRRSA